jgi:hypothetical protein
VEPEKYVGLEGNFAANIITFCGEIERLDLIGDREALLDRLDEIKTQARMELEYLARIKAVSAPYAFEVREFWEGKNAKDRELQIPQPVKTRIDWDALKQARESLKKSFGEL